MGFSRTRRCLLIWLLLTLLVAGSIFWFSSQPASQSDSLSRGLLERLLQFLLGASYRARLLRLNHQFRKLAHFVEYAVLGVCLAGTFRYQKRVPPLAAALVAGFLYAATDELHQRFVAGRGPQFKDVLLDTSGVAVGALSLLLLLRLFRALRKPTQTKQETPS